MAKARLQAVLITLYLMLLTQFTTAQIVTDSIFQRVSSQRSRDSLKIVAGNINLKVDSIVGLYNSELRQLEVDSSPFHNSIDSANASFRRMESSIASIFHEEANEIKDSTVRVYKQRLDSVLVSKKSLLDSLRKMQSNLPFEKLSVSPPDMKISVSIDELKTTEIFLDKISIPDLTPATHLELPALEKLPEMDVAVPEYKIDVVNDMANHLKIRGLPEEVSQISAVLKDGVENKLNKESLESIAEQSIQEVPGVTDIEGKEQLFQDYKRQLDEINSRLQDREALQRELDSKATDYLQGKEQVVQKDLEDIAKIQMKYGEVKDSRYLPKRPPNPLRGRPFVERLVPGLTMQLMYSENISADVNPFIAYKLTPKAQIGFGGYRRLTYFSQEESIGAVKTYGLRLYSTFALTRPVSLYLDYERFKSNDPQGNHQIVINDNWQKKLNFGGYTHYRITERIFGHSIITYDIIKIRSFPNSTGSSIRFGFDYKLQKREKRLPKKHLGC